MSTDVVFTDADGHVGGKIQDLEALRSGDEKMHSIELKDLRVHVYENTAIAAGANVMRWSRFSEYRGWKARKYFLLPDEGEKCH